MCMHVYRQYGFPTWAPGPTETCTTSATFAKRLQRLQCWSVLALRGETMKHPRDHLRGRLSYSLFFLISHCGCVDLHVYIEAYESLGPDPGGYPTTRASSATSATFAHLQRLQRLQCMRRVQREQRGQRVPRLQRLHDVPRGHSLPGPPLDSPKGPLDERDTMLESPFFSTWCSPIWGNLLYITREAYRQIY